MNVMNPLKKIVLAAAVFFALSCAGGPVEIPDTLTAAEMVQRAQESSDRNRFSIALHYYSTVLERFPADYEYVCAAEYEIGFIHYKQKKYDLAKTEFNALLARYNTPDEELLPPQYKVLAQNILKTIEETERSGEPAPTAEELSQTP